MSAYRAAVEACLNEVGQPAPIWVECSNAVYPGDVRDVVAWEAWSAAIEKAVELAGPLWTKDDDWDGESVIFESARWMA